ncbi:serine O-acetyltransferase EpsC [Collimonas fungivorans]|uniref:Serine acetyltransferase n=2 Tax=Collimonas fungivorans TaxID=158899 RepID=G0ABQ0_COLFT|nr:serine O-acetyltransferase EpsC [Collimonas fungivorans]AEK61856.1 Serine acetyltransferase [Collimonas fungivorans Ter331]
MSSRNFSEQQALTDSSGLGLEQVVSALRTSREVTNKIRHRGDIRELPSRQALAEVLQGLSAALFPTHYGRTDLNDENIDHFVGNTLSFTLNILAEQIRRGLLFVLEESTPEADLNRQAIAVTRQFAAGLPAIRDLLASDIQAAYSGDPAATSISEILLCYPGTTAIIYHRLAHALHGLGAPLLARLIADIAHSATGIDIHPAARIGASFFIDHGTGVVIGETTIIGQRVRLYQAVTLGAKRFPADQDGALIKGNERHPIVEDDVVIYAGATVLGRVTIGKGSTIGGNVWLTRSVPPGSNISQAQMRDD